MAFEQCNNSGTLFKNDRKEKETHPDYKGSALIDGVEYWFDAWIKTSQSGKKFLSAAFKPKESQQAPPKKADENQSKKPKQEKEIDVDDVPF